MIRYGPLLCALAKTLHRASAVLSADLGRGVVLRAERLVDRHGLRFIAHVDGFAAEFWESYAIPYEQQITGRGWEANAEHTLLLLVDRVRDAVEAWPYAATEAEACWAALYGVAWRAG